MKNKTLISLAIASILPLSASRAFAAGPLINGDVLNITPGVVSTTYSGAAAVKTGSWFAMGSTAPTARTPLGNYEGLILGITQSASGSHSGAPGCSGCGDTTPSSESPSIDLPWGFYGNTGMDYTTSATNVLSTGTGTAVVDFSGWTVTWNGIVAIPMGSGAWNPTSGPLAGTYTNGQAQVTCGVDCYVGDTYTLNYTGTVPANDPSGFGGVQYALHLVGTIEAACTGDSAAPTTTADSYNVPTNSSSYPLAILANDTDMVSGSCSSGLDKGSVVITTQPTHGTATVNPTTGVVSYTPTSGYQGSDSFQYTVADRNGNPSAATAVNITVKTYPPTCVDDGIPEGAHMNPDNVANVTVDELANDIPGTFGMDPKTVQIIQQPAHGSVNVNSTTGAITYTPNTGFTGFDPFTYTVNDNGSTGGGTGTVLTCAAATVNMFVSTAVPTAQYMWITPGNVGTNNKVMPAAGDGSWFSMETQPGVFTYTPISGYNGIDTTAIQAASTAGGKVTTNIDEAWTFFGNLGVDQTTSIPIVLTHPSTNLTQATFDFSGWNVSWNGIASIPMNSGATVPGYTNGVAQVTCAVDCSAGDSYTLNYSATVPQGSKTGFDGVHYFLHLEGQFSDTLPVAGCLDTTAPSDVSTTSVIDDCTNRNSLVFSPGDLATAVGNSTGTGLTAAQISPADPLLNPTDGKMCVGGCLDFKIKNLPGDHADVVVKLGAPIPVGGVYRKLINGKWQDFDTSGKDVVASAPLDSSTSNCPEPTGTYSLGLRPGNQCLYLKIYDNGPNDNDSATGTIADPSGVLLPGSANVPPSSSSGCSISKTPVKLSDRADWIVVALFMAVLGISRRRLTNKK